MVLYVFLVGVVNLGLGCFVAVQLARRCRQATAQTAAVPLPDDHASTGLLQPATAEDVACAIQDLLDGGSLDTPEDPPREGTTSEDAPPPAATPADSEPEEARAAPSADKEPCPEASGDQEERSCELPEADARPAGSAPGRSTATPPDPTPGQETDPPPERDPARAEAPAEAELEQAWVRQAEELEDEEVAAAEHVPQGADPASASRAGGPAGEPMPAGTPSCDNPAEAEPGVAARGPAAGPSDEKPVGDGDGGEPNEEARQDFLDLFLSLHRARQAGDDLAEGLGSDQAAADTSTPPGQADAEPPPQLAEFDAKPDEPAEPLPEPDEPGLESPPGNTPAETVNPPGGQALRGGFPQTKTGRED